MHTVGFVLGAIQPSVLPMSLFYVKRKHYKKFMKFILVILVSFFNNFQYTATIAISQRRCNIHGYLLVGYITRDLDSMCLINLPNEISKNHCLTEMDNYVTDIIPDRNATQNFDAVYTKDAQSEANAIIKISTLERRVTSEDISYLMQDTNLKRLKRKFIPKPGLNSRFYLNKLAGNQTFVYRIFRFEGMFINKKIENTSEAQSLLEAITGRTYNHITADSLNMYLFYNFRYIKEVSTTNFISQSFEVIK